MENTCQIKKTRQHVFRVFELGLYLSAMVLACLIAKDSKITVTASSTAILGPAILLMLIPTKRESVIVIQKIVAIYLVFLLFGQTASRYLVMNIAKYQVNLSGSIAVLALCLGGYLGGKFTGIKKVGYIAKDAGPGQGWWLGLAIIMLHMLFLTPLLHSFYGYGYERNPAVLGRIIFCLFIFAFFWGTLSRWILRGCIGVIVIVYCFVICQ